MHTRFRVESIRTIEMDVISTAACINTIGILCIEISHEASGAGNR